MKKGFLRNRVFIASVNGKLCSALNLQSDDAGQRVATFQAELQELIRFLHGLFGSFVG